MSIELIRKLRGTECVCGGSKQARMSHCRKCYWALPPEMRQAMYRLMGKGYEEAYKTSLAELKRIGRMTGSGKTCQHERLTEEGTCRICGEDRRGA